MQPRSLSAHVERARGVDSFDAVIDLGFGVTLHRQVRIRRSDPFLNVPAGKMGEANHCLVILIGGKDVTLIDAREDRGLVTAGVYLTAVGGGLQPVEIPGLTGRFIDVYAALRWAELNGWDPKLTREAVK